MGKCLKDPNGYHDCIQFHNYPDAVIEGCKSCNKKLIYYKRDGKINEAEYYNDHIKDFCQPYGSTAKIFDKVYGKQGRRRVSDVRRSYEGIYSKSKIAADWDETIRDAQRDMRSMNDFGKSTISTGL